MLVTLYKVSELYFRVLGMNGFHGKAENERFTVAVSRCRQNLKHENFKHFSGRLRQKIAPKACHTCSLISCRPHPGWSLTAIIGMASVFDLSVSFDFISIMFYCWSNRLNENEFDSSSL